MPEKTFTMEDVKGRALDDLLRQVARDRETIIVVLEQRQVVEIRPLGALKPLPQLKGFVTKGWKDGIYAR